MEILKLRVFDEIHVNEYFFTLIEVSFSYQFTSFGEDMIYNPARSWMPIMARAPSFVYSFETGKTAVYFI